MSIFFFRLELCILERIGSLENTFRFWRQFLGSLLLPLDNRCIHDAITVCICGRNIIFFLVFPHVSGNARKYLRNHGNLKACAAQTIGMASRVSWPYLDLSAIAYSRSSKFWRPFVLSCPKHTAFTLSYIQTLRVQVR